MRSYTTVDNAFLHDRDMDNRCRGLLVTMISLPDGWKFSVKGLASLYNTEGVDSVRSTRHKLEQLGYLIRKPLRDEFGRMYEMEYNVYDVSQLDSNADKRSPEDSDGVEDLCKKNPSSGKPIAGKPTTAKPITEKPTQYNTKESKNQRINH